MNSCVTGSLLDCKFLAGRFCDLGMPASPKPRVCTSEGHLRSLWSCGNEPSRRNYVLAPLGLRPCLSIAWLLSQLKKQASILSFPHPEDRKQSLDYLTCHKSYRCEWEGETIKRGLGFVCFWFWFLVFNFFLNSFPIHHCTSASQPQQRRRGADGVNSTV